MTANQERFLEILKSSLGGEEYKAEILRSDLEEIFRLADIQLLLPIVFESVFRSANNENAALFKAVKPYVIKGVAGQIAQNAEFSELYRKMLDSGLHPMIVKGQICSKLYPLPDHRISTDDDILLSSDEYEKCRRLLEESGFSAETEDDGSRYEVGYNNGFIRIELHRMLFDPTEGHSDELNRFFADVQKKSTTYGDFLSMPPHEHMLYLLLHSFKHFMVCGVGLRQVCDIGLWAREYSENVDWELLRSQLSSVRADKFAAAQFKIARECLGLEFSLPLVWEKMLNKVEICDMLDDMFDGGLYGSSSLDRLHSSTAVLSAVRADQTGKKANVLESVFPKFSYMAVKYDYVKKYPILLPIGWADRIIGYLREMRNESSNAASSLKIARERVELLREYGVIK